MHDGHQGIYLSLLWLDKRDLLQVIADRAGRYN